MASNTGGDGGGNNGGVGGSTAGANGEMGPLMIRKVTVVKGI